MPDRVKVWGHAPCSTPLECVKLHEVCENGDSSEDLGESCPNRHGGCFLRRPQEGKPLGEDWVLTFPRTRPEGDWTDLQKVRK